MKKRQYINGEPAYRVVGSRGQEPRTRPPPTYNVKPDPTASVLIDSLDRLVLDDSGSRPSTQPLASGVNLSTLTGSEVVPNNTEQESVRTPQPTDDPAKDPEPEPVHSPQLKNDPVEDAKPEHVSSPQPTHDPVEDAKPEHVSSPQPTHDPVEDAKPEPVSSPRPTHDPVEDSEQEPVPSPQLSGDAVKILMQEPAHSPQLTDAIKIIMQEPQLTDQPIKSTEQDLAPSPQITDQTQIGKKQGEDESTGDATLPAAPELDALASTMPSKDPPTVENVDATEASQARLGYEPEEGEVILDAVHPDKNPDEHADAL